MPQKIILLLVWLVSCSVAGIAVAADNVDGKEIEVAGIKLSDHKDRVRKLIGNPLEWGPKTCDGCFDITDSWFIYDGIRVHFLQSEVFQLEVTTKDYRLVSGVGVGSSREEVVRQYGQPKITSHEEGVVLAYPITWDGRGHPDVKLEFLIDDDVVIGFQAGPTRTGSSF